MVWIGRVNAKAHVLSVSQTFKCNQISSPLEMTELECEMDSKWIPCSLLWQKQQKTNTVTDWHLEVLNINLFGMKNR